MKLPPSSMGTFGWQMTFPTVSQSPTATVGFIYPRGIPCTCTQKWVRLNDSSSAIESLPYRCRTIRCLSKLHGLLAIIVSTSSSLSKVNKITWLPRFFTLKPFLDRHNGLKVAAIASVFKACFIKNFAAIVYSAEAKFECNRNLGPSLCERESPFHYTMRSSMVQEMKSVSLSPKKKTHNKTLV